MTTERCIDVPAYFGLLHGAYSFADSETSGEKDENKKRELFTNLSLIYGQCLRDAGTYVTCANKIVRESTQNAWGSGHVDILKHMEIIDNNTCFLAHSVLS